jgi:hypothetical protein
VRKIEENNLLKNVGVNRRIILKWLIKKQGERVWAGGTQFWKGSDGGLLEHDNEFSRSTTRGKFLEWLCDCRLPWKTSVVCS